MRLRSLLPATVVASTVLFTGCDSDIASPLESFQSFTIVIEVRDSGPGVDGDGFIVTVDPSDTVLRVAAGELARLQMQSKGPSYTVTLSDIAVNCAVLDGFARRITVRENDIMTLARRAEFNVECS